MHKSQLRRLALDFAHGKLDADDYRQQRDELLDGIESGDVAIDRESPLDLGATQPLAFETLPPPQPETPPTQAAEAPAAEESAPRAGTRPRAGALAAPSPLYAGIGAGALVVLVLLGVWLVGGEEEPPPPPTTVTTAPVESTRPALSPVRALVEAFVAEKDFTAAGLERFGRRWQALDAAEVEAARGTPWFRRLVTAVVQEVKTQKALAELDGTGRALQSARRVSEFGRFLGISDSMLPAVAETGTASANASAAVTITTLGAGSAQSAPAGVAPAEGPDQPPGGADEPVTVPEPPAADEHAAAAQPSTPPTPLPPAAPTPRGREWLARQPPDSYTLQLFALNHLEKVERLIANHPELPLRLVDYAPESPRYRVFIGSYRSAEAARAAHATLPEAVRRAQPDAFVRPVAELVAPPPPATLLAATTAAASTTAATPAAAQASRPASPSSDWLLDQPAARFTLQLFASNSRDNAERLIGRFPDLALALHESQDERSRFRVLYGSFASGEEARRAFEALPQPLSDGAGVPLVKSIGELQRTEVSAD